MKIPFTLDAWLKDTSQKVVDEDERPVRIICTDADGLYPIIGLVDNKIPLPCGKNGRPPYIGGGGGTLFLVTPEPELSEFENKLREICEDAVIESRLFPERTSEDFAKKHSAELLELAIERVGHKWVIRQESYQDGYINGLHDGKAEALKDLPRWRKWGNGACGNGRGIPLAIVKRGLNGYELVDALCIQGEQYIMLSDLEKLPKED